MKLRTSFCNPTVLRKDITRFAPVWGCYTIMLLLVLSGFVTLRTPYIRCLNAADMVAPMAVVNLIYAFLVVQLLFGDLFNSRMCNALHAMPLTREGWFGSHVAAALLFSLVPNLLAALVCMPFLAQGWTVPLYWLAASTMQYIFFLGTALVSAMLVGNRFAMLAVYVLINFLSILFYWFADTIYEPMLYGVRFSNDIFVRLSPCVQMSRFYQMVNVGLIVIEAVDGPVTAYETSSGAVHVSAYEDPQQFTVQLGTGWGYHGICTIIGIGLIFLALALYRRRKLETAGDFIALRAVEPVFLVLFTLGVGAFFQLCAQVFGIGTQLIFLAAGLVVGYYGCRMLLMRTTRVFQPRALIGVGLIGLVLAGSIGLMRMDAFGIVRRIPETAKVRSVTISESAYIASNTPLYSFEDPGDIEQVRQLHQDVLDGRSASTAEEYYSTCVYLVYTLTDGSTLTRYYEDVNVQSVAGQKLKDYYTRPEFVLRLDPSQYDEMAENITYLWFGEGSVNSNELADYDLKGLVRAIDADCRAGNMAQDSGYHVDEYRLGWLELEYKLQADWNQYFGIVVYSSCENTAAWLEANGFELEYDLIGG